jgi:hypothetical protein
VVNALGKCLNITWINRWEHTDSQLILSELSVRLGIYNPILTQYRRDLGRINCIIKVNCSNDL